MIRRPAGGKRGCSVVLLDRADAANPVDAWRPDAGRVRLGVRTFGETVHPNSDRDTCTGPADSRAWRCVRLDLPPDLQGRISPTA